MNAAPAPHGTPPPALTVRVGDWSVLGEQAAAVRTAVFVREQGIPAEHEWDVMDGQSVHCVACRGVRPIGTGRLLPDGRIGRMAVESDARGQGVGAVILDALIDVARRRGDRRVWLHSQRAAMGFYARRGFETIGEPFDEVGIEHVTMQRVL